MLACTRPAPHPRADHALRDLRLLRCRGQGRCSRRGCLWCAPPEPSPRASATLRQAQANASTLGHGIQLQALLGHHGVAPILVKLISALRRNNRIRDETQTALDGVDLVLSCLVLSCLVLSCLVLSCLVLSCLVLSCLVLSCLVLSCLVLSCLVLSCLVSSRLVSSRLVSSRLVSSRLVSSRLVLSCLVLSCRCVQPVCSYARGRGLKFTSAHVLVRAPVDGPGSQPIDIRDYTSSVSRALMPTLVVQPPHVCHRQRDWAVFIGSHMQQDIDIAKAPPALRSLCLNRSRQKTTIPKNGDKFSLRHRCL